MCVGGGGVGGVRAGGHGEFVWTLARQKRIVFTNIYVTDISQVGDFLAQSMGIIMPEQSNLISADPLHGKLQFPKLNKKMDRYYLFRQ